MSVDALEWMQTLAQEFSLAVIKQDSAYHAAKEALEFVFLTSLHGHHCVSVSEEGIHPDPSQALAPHFLERDLLKTSFFALEKLLAKLSTKMQILPIHQQGKDFYLHKTYMMQHALVFHLAQLQRSPLEHVFDHDLILKIAQPYRSFLNEQQYAAVVEGLRHPLHLLSGGPGTGKSYTVFYLLKTLIDLYALKQLQPKVLVIAPTGKAASVLSERLVSLKNRIVVDVSTAHKALKAAFRKDNIYHQLIGYDLIVLDEASMVDLGLFATLFRCIPKGVRVILMGDHYQLPPVEGSMVFQHLLQVLPHSILKESKRVENKALLEISEKIKEEDREYFEQLISGDILHPELEYMQCSTEEPLDLLLQKVGDPNIFAATFLTPIKHGPWGTEALNSQMLTKTQEKQDSKIPILVTKNQYELEIFNGDIGYLKYLPEPVGVFSSALGEKVVPLCLIEQWTTAFALTIHKSQGSEYDHVALFLPQGAERFGKQLLYTAVTRAKRKITIFAVEGVLLKCLKQTSEKHSQLAQELQSALHS